MRNSGRILTLVLVVVFAISGLGISAVTARQDTPTAWLGVGVTDESDEVVVIQVAPGSPADEAGIFIGDVIFSLDDTDITTSAALVEAVQTYAPGDTVTLHVITDGEEREVDVTLDVRPVIESDTTEEPSALPIPGGGVLNFLGLNATQTDQGWEIASLDDDSPLQDSGLQEGDIITAINGTDALTITARELMQALRLGDTVSLTILRDGETLEIEVPLPEDAFGFGLMQPGIGVEGDEEMAEAMLSQVLGIEGSLVDEGLRLDTIRESSPLATTDLAEGDIIIALNGVSVNEMAYTDAIRILLSSDTVSVSVLRDGEPLEIDVTLDFAGMGLGHMLPFGDTMPFEEGMPFQALPPQTTQPTQLGVLFTVITAELAESEDLPVTEGALIEEVYGGTPAADAGLLAGDIITAVDEDAVDEEHTLKDRLYAYETGDVVTLTVLRDGETITLDVTLGINPRDGLTYMLPGDMNGYGYHFSVPHGHGNGRWRFSVPNGRLGDLEQFFKDHPFLGDDFDFSIPDRAKPATPDYPNMRQS